MIALLEQGCQIFISTKYQNLKMTTKYTKWPLTIRNVGKIDQMAAKFTNIFHCKTLQNFTQIGILGLKMYHLATLFQSSFFESRYFCSLMLFVQRTYLFIQI
jgi:hypothetical protein